VSKRASIIMFSVMVILLAAFSVVPAKAAGSNPWNYNCWNSGDWTQCNCNWYSCPTYYVPPQPALCASFVSDVTVQDGSYMTPGSTFTKTWRIKNNGTTTWNTGYKLFFSSGSQMSGPSWVALPHIVAPGQTVDLSVNLTAPSGSGTYRSNWKLQSDSGATFGVGSNCQVPIWAEITTKQPVYNNCCYSNCNYYPYNYNYCGTTWSAPSWQNWSTTQAPAYPTWPGWK